jgi:exodeoxyribonuclease V alpha subunit
MARPRPQPRPKKTRSSRPTAAPIGDVVAVLRTVEFPAHRIQQIRRRYGESVEQAIRSHPYRLVQDIAGVSFAQADTVARRLGRGKGDRERVRAGIREILTRGFRAGHTCLPLRNVVTRAAQLLQVSRVVVEEQCLRSALELGGNLVVDQRGRETLLVPLDMRRIEERVALNLTDRARGLLPPLVHEGETVAQDIASRRGLNAEQSQAIQAVLSSALTVVTGGPGTGKSSFCQALTELAHQQHLAMLAAAPTGRAAQRLTEVAGLPAATLHRVLEYQPSTGTFLRTADYPLATSVLVIDEASMLDLVLFDHVRQALPLDARLVLIGDVDHLPSVGPGQVLADMITAGVARTVRLTQLYRRSESSRIPLSAHHIRAGQVPQLSAAPDSDFRFLAVPEPAQVLARVVELVAHEIPATLGSDPFTDIQVLAPLNIGPIGTQALNQALQQRLNPEGQRVRLSPEKELRVGDRLVVTENNYRLNVFNGDTGTLIRAQPEKQLVVLQTSRDEVMFVGKELTALTLGYAVSVHRAQGGEFPAVVVVLHDLHAPLLQRTLLYTAITRAKRLCVIVGTRRALLHAVGNVRALQRHTGLVPAIRQAWPALGPRALPS